MTTIPQRFHYISSIDMSYDEMNFTTRIGDDDIDIDIDLETGPNDEDYILEDVNSDEGNEDSLVNNDDVMIDDENITYPMDDVEALHHEHIEMKDADLSDRPAAGLNNSGLDVTLVEDTSLYAPALGEGRETVLDELQPRETQLEDVEAKQVYGGQIPTEGSESLQNETVKTNFTHSAPIAPQQHVLDVQAGADQHIPTPYSPYSHSSGAEIREQNSADEVSVSKNAPVVGQAQEENEVKSGEGNSLITSPDIVVVTYQDMEYALFSTNESDDPDTFFLKDRNLINGSLGDLITGLRSIIHEDLASDDELCLAIDDLGIEISETCISIHKVNFASVIDLHQRLLRNDGLETPTALHITLSVKPDFAKRLASLANGAADGKGLSDLVSWDESSEVLEEDEKPVHIEGGMSSETTDQNTVEGDESTEIYGNTLVGDDGEDKNLSEDNNPNRNLGGNSGKVDREQVSDPHNRPAVSDTGSPGEDHQVQEMTPGRKSTTQVANVSGHSEDHHNQDHDGEDDGDLIDYEDEEYELIHETSNPAAVDSDIKPNENATLNTNSLQITTEWDQDEVQSKVDASRSSSVHSGQDPGPDTSHETDDDRDPFSEFQYPEEYENNEDFEQGGEELHISYVDEERGSEEDGDVNVAADDTAVNARESFDPLEPGHEAVPPETTDDGIEELDYGITGQDLTDTYDRGSNTELPVENNKSTTVTVSGGDHDTDEISYEEENVLDSNESEHTLIADQSGQDPNVEAAGNRQDDEINYESDSQGDLQSHLYHDTTADTSPTSNGFSGKRQRKDIDDTSERTPKQSKRARS